MTVVDIVFLSFPLIVAKQNYPPPIRGDREVVKICRRPQTASYDPYNTDNLGGEDKCF